MAARVGWCRLVSARGHQFATILVTKTLDVHDGCSRRLSSGLRSAVTLCYVRLSVRLVCVDMKYAL
jgi:hypothetical protein